MIKVTKDTTLAKILKSLKAKEILAKYNLPCLSCPFAKMEMENLKINDICETYNINLHALLKELNNIDEK